MHFNVTTGFVDITPTRPIPLAGWKDRTGTFSGVADRLETAGILLRVGDRSVCVLSADLLYIGEALFDDAYDRVRTLGGEDTGLLFAATHTHFAPSTDPAKPLLGATDPAYLRWVIEQVRGLIELLFQAPPVASKLIYATGHADHCVNRRKRVWRLKGILPHREVRLRPNPRGFRDDTVRLIRVESMQGTRIAILWSYACHPVAFPHRGQVSADYPGIVRQRFRQNSSSELPVLFLQGFSGDLRPPSYPGSGFMEDENPGVLPRKRRFGVFNVEQYRKWASSLADEVVSVDGLANRRSLQPALEWKESRIDLDKILEGKETTGPPLHAVRLSIGKELEMIGLSAEVTSPYLEVVRRRFVGAETVPIGCVGPVFGYLPSDQMLKEGGFESEGFLNAAGHGGRFASGIEKRIEDLLGTL
jgi:hypothetical protein